MDEIKTGNILSCIDRCGSRTAPEADTEKAYAELRALVLRAKNAEYDLKLKKEFIDFLLSEKIKLEIKLEGVTK